MGGPVIHIPNAGVQVSWHLVYDRGKTELETDKQSRAVRDFPLKQFQC